MLAGFELESTSSSSHKTEDKMKTALQRCIPFVSMAYLVACGAEVDYTGQQSFALGGTDETTFEDEAAALETDLVLVAEQTGIPLDQVRISRQFQQDFGDRMERVFGEEARNIAGVWVDPIPAVRGHIVFVGDVPAEAAEFVADPNVEVSGGATLSMSTQYALVRHLAAAAAAIGFSDNVVSYQPQTQRIRVESARDASGHLVDKEGLAAEVTRRISAIPGFPETFTADEFDLAEKTEPIYSMATIGGEAMRDDGVFECTGSWVVSSGATRGVMSAAHCNGLNQTVSADAVRTTSWQAATTYANGDVEWHTTTGSEIGQFFADSATVRDITSTRLTSFQVGQTVCFYGRSSNTRWCSNTVSSVGSCYNNTVEGQICNVAITSSPSHPMIPGDSGGGWSWNNEAYGVTSGANSTQIFYSTINEGLNNLSLGIPMNGQ
jgi:hypothetical protein